MSYRGGLGLCVLCLAAAPLLGAPAHADQTVKIGNILALTGDGAAVGQEIQKGEILYVKLHTKDLPTGIHIDLITRDDASKPDNTRRLAQELIVRDHVQMLSGFTLSPQAFAVAPVITEAKVPAVIMNASTGSITRSSPYLVRFSHSNWQMAYTIGTWAAKHDIKKAYTLVADYAAGLDQEAAFKRGFTDAGGTIVGSDRTPLSTTDYLPYMQRVKNASPQALFLFEIAGSATIATFKAFSDAGLKTAGVVPLGAGDVVPDDELAQVGPSAVGATTGSIYSTSFDTPANKAFLAEWRKEYGPAALPEFASVAGWIGMKAIFSVASQLGDKATGDAAMTAFKNYKDPDSPEGPISIDPETRDVILNVYLCKVEQVGAGFENLPFETIKDVKDPWKILNPPS